TLPSEMVVWQPEFTDKTLSRKTGAVHSVCLDSNQINILNTASGKWKDPVVCETSEETLKKAAQFVRSALLKGAKKL
ncbi:hypothetical protein PO513_23325, partial [Escherichia coli]